MYEIIEHVTRDIWDEHDKRLEVILNTTASCDQEAESRNPSPISLAAGKHNRGDSDTENATDWKWLNHIEPITETYIETVYVCELLEKLLESTNDIKRPEDFLRVTGQNHLRACTTVQQHNKAMVLGNGATEFLLICHCVNRRQSVQVIVDCLKPPYAFIGYLTTCYVPRALCLRPTAMPGRESWWACEKTAEPKHWTSLNRNLMKDPNSGVQIQIDRSRKRGRDGKRYLRQHLHRKKWSLIARMLPFPSVQVSLERNNNSGGKFWGNLFSI